MRKMFKKAVALALAAVMMIPMMGISASAATVYKEIDTTGFVVKQFKFVRTGDNAVVRKNDGTGYELTPGEGNTFSFTDADGSGWFDKDETTGLSGSNTTAFYIDLGQELTIDKMDIESPYVNNNTKGTSPIIALTNDEPTSNRIAALEFTRINPNPKNRPEKLDNYSVEYANETDGTCTWTAKDNATSTSYRYIIVDGNGSNSAIKRITLYTATKVNTVTLRDETGSAPTSTDYEVPGGKAVKLSHDKEVAWYINNVLVAKASTLVYVPDGDVTIVAKPVSDDVIPGVVITSDLNENKEFTVAMGEGVKRFTIFLETDTKLGKVVYESDGESVKQVKFTLGEDLQDVLSVSVNEL